MASFKVGENVGIQAANGNPYTGTADAKTVFVTRDDLATTETVAISRLTPMRGPNIRVNGEVLTASVKHPNEQGLIVGTGRTKGNMKFYKVEFAEDQIFLEAPRVHQLQMTTDAFNSELIFSENAETGSINFFIAPDIGVSQMSQVSQGCSLICTQFLSSSYV